MEVPINYLAVLVSAIAAVVIGALWYGPVFGKPWMKMMGFDMAAMKGMKMTPIGAMIGGFITSLLMAYVLSHIYVFASTYMGTAGVMGGLSSGFWIWLGFAVPMTGASYLFEGKPLKLWVLNAAYYLVVLLAMGAIIGAWQ